jgi:hypothetical protein
MAMLQEPAGLLTGLGGGCVKPFVSLAARNRNTIATPAMNPDASGHIPFGYCRYRTCHHMEIEKSERLTPTRSSCLANSAARHQRLARDLADVSPRLRSAFWA